MQSACLDAMVSLISSLEWLWRRPDLMMSDTFILNFRGDQITDELLIYHALITLESCIERPWELVVDFTHTTLENRFSVSGKIYVLLLPNVTWKQIIYLILWQILCFHFWVFFFNEHRLWKVNDAIGCVNWLKCFIVTKVPTRSHLSQFGSLHFVTN